MTFMASYDEQQKFLKYLKINNKGLTVGEISKALNMNRNSAAKYLDILFTQGNVEMRQIGPAKLYFPSQRVPTSKLLDHSSDEILVLDDSFLVLQVNATLLRDLKFTMKDIIGKSVYDIPLYALKEKKFLEDLKSSSDSDELTGIYSYVFRKKRSYYKYKMIKSCFDNGTCGLTIIFENITAQKEYERTLEMSVKLEDIASQIATDFIYVKKEQFDNHVNNALEKASHAISVDKTIVCLFDDDFDSFNVEYAWTSNSDFIDPFELDKEYPTSMYSFWLESFKSFEMYFLHKTKKIEGYEDKQKFLQDRGIKSMLAAPIIYEGNLIGFIGFMMMDSSRFWSESTTGYIRSLSRIFSQILKKRGLVE